MRSLSESCIGSFVSIELTAGVLPDASLVSAVSDTPDVSIAVVAAGIVA